MCFAIFQKRLVDSGEMLPGERVVAVLTGHLLKDPGSLLDYHRDRRPAPPGANPPIEIEPDVREIARVLGR